MTYTEWLLHIQQHHTTLIDLGLTRIATIAQRLNVLRFNCPVIMVSGTNGKGTCVFALEAVYRQAGYHTGLFHSPFIYRPQEQIRYDQTQTSEAELCAAFTAINHACGDITLTEFEWWTLAALWLFQQQKPDVVILEVGMGGKDDAVNIVDADIAIITNVALEHQHWLGDTREAIATHKAGIMRPGKAVILGHPDMPAPIHTYAATLNAKVYQYGKTFQATVKTRYAENSIACALQAVSLLSSLLPVSEHHRQQALNTLQLPGRFEYSQHHLWDVAHNPDATLMLRAHLQQHYPNQRCYAVLSVFSDKAVTEMVSIMKAVITQWWIAPMQHPRSMSLENLRIQTAVIQNDSHYCSTVATAYSSAQKHATQDHALLVVFGSFALLRECRPEQTAH